MIWPMSDSLAQPTSGKLHRPIIKAAAFGTGGASPCQRPEFSARKQQRFKGEAKNEAAFIIAGNMVAQTDRGFTPEAIGDAEIGIGRAVLHPAKRTRKAEGIIHRLFARQL